MVEPKTSSVAQQVQQKEQPGQTPFFNKEGGQGDHGHAAPPPFFNGGNGAGFFQRKEAPGKPAPVQTKLTVGQPGDKYEQEADQVADKVVQRLATDKTTPANESGNSLVQRKCDTCEKEEKDAQPVQKMPEQISRKPIFESNAPEDTIQRKCDTCGKEMEDKAPGVQVDSEGSTGADSGGLSSIESGLSASKGGGSPLPANTQSSMESAMGADFSGVRVHTDSSAVQMSKDLVAHAFTHGSDIYFNSGKYDTGSSGGQRLLAHELTHTVQQGEGKNRVQRQPEGYVHSEDGQQSKEGIKEEKNTENQKELKTASPEEPLTNPDVPIGYIQYEIHITHYGTYHLIKRHFRDDSKLFVPPSVFDIEKQTREAQFGKVEPVIRHNRIFKEPKHRNLYDYSEIYTYPLTEKEKILENQRLGNTSDEVKSDPSFGNKETGNQDIIPARPASTPQPEQKIAEGDAKSNKEADKTTVSENEGQSSGPYWKHEWHIDRFGREALFVWEVGGKSRYTKPDPGLSHIRKMASILPGGAGYDPRFEKFKHRPQVSEGQNPELNWWMKKTPGWDNPDHVDNGTADFEDLAEFKDAADNKKGTGFYYMGYIFDPLIYEKLEEEKRNKVNKKYIGNVTNYKGYVNAENGIILHDTPSPGDEAYQTKRKNKEEYVINHNQPLTVIAEGNADNEGWVLVKTPIGEVGWIERRYTSKEPEAAKSQEMFPSYTVQEGDNLESLIDSYYKDYPYATGNDRRTIALAIYLYNKDKPGSGVYRNIDKYKSAGSWKDTLDPWMKETRANYESVELYSGGKVLLPPVEFIQKMRRLGEIEKRPDFVNATIEGGRVIQGFIAGVGIGFWEALEGAVEDLYDLIVDIFTGEIFNQIAEMFNTIMELGLEGIWDKIKEFGTSTWEEVKAAWNNPNPYERGKYFGEIIGMILFEVVLAILTAGVGTVVKNSTRVTKIMKLFPSWTKKIDTPEYKDRYDKVDRSGDKDFDLDKDKNKTDSDKDKDKEKNDKESDEDKAKEAQALLAAKVYVESQDALSPSPEVRFVLSVINKTPGMKLSGGKRYKAERNSKGEGHFEIYYNPTVDTDYSEGKGNSKEEIEKQKRQELDSRKKRMNEVELKNELTVRGFKNAGEYVERIGNLRKRIKMLDIKGIGKLDDVEVGIRGSSVTGVSSKGGNFRPGIDGLEKPSDLDFFFSSKKLDDYLRKQGFDLSEPISPKDLGDLSPEIRETLGEFADESRGQLGRKSDAYFLSNEVLEKLTVGDYILQ